VGITDTSRELIRDIIAKAGLEGLSIDETSRLLVKEFTKFSRFRARMIARTEIINASNKGSLLAAQATGLNVQKKWISTYDKRTRNDHREVNGKLTDLNGEFEVGGEMLSYPGDPKGSAQNVINCRCAIGYKRY
jgi:SPP1 gp7 family putative phage head morphogenesis protein